MGALRKTAPEILQPTQIIIFPVDQVRSQPVEGPTWWEKFQDSDAGSLILFEAKMFGLTAFFVALTGMIGYFAIFSKEASGIELSDTMSWSGTKSALMQPHSRFPFQANYE
ncbi:MAG: hypothetical protein JNM28_00310 [Armatimonadetes bacterium]|nr:hypothetical protein [Armatimonadota bacterium]MBS1711365.1 hypothetical protein [Armatimonadota bacterium]MBX3107710.1 hypothetical protein [Fimbriimonadaceae bacterium]